MKKILALALCCAMMFSSFITIGCNKDKSGKNEEKFDMVTFSYDYTDVVKTCMNCIVSKSFGSLLSLGINAIFGTDSTDSKTLDELLDNMQKINSTLNQLEADVRQLIEEVKDTDFRDQMRGLQNVMEGLTAKLSAYQGGAKALSKLTPATEKYNSELKIYADMINNNGDFHEYTFSLGNKLFNDAMGTSEGAIAAHTDYLYRTLNWERSVYQPIQEFFVYTVGTYYQAAAYNLIALRYVAETDESEVRRSAAEAQITQIGNQIDSIKNKIGQIKIKYLKDEYNVSLKTKIVIKNKIDLYKYGRKNSFIDYSKMGTRNGEEYFSCPETHLLSRAQAASLLSYAKTGSYLLEDMRRGGCEVDSYSADHRVMTCDYTIDQQVQWLPNGGYIFNKRDGYYITFTTKEEKKLAPTGLFSSSFLAAIPQFVGIRAEGDNSYYKN